jgi:hypothetical protein
MLDCSSLNSPVGLGSELPDHSRSTCLPGLFSDCWAPFFVTDSVMQDQPDQPTLSMSDCPDGLIMSQARDGAAIHNLKDTSFDLYGSVGRLVENTPHVAVALRGSVVVVHTRPLRAHRSRMTARTFTILSYSERTHASKVLTRSPLRKTAQQKGLRFRNEWPRLEGTSQPN